MRRLSQNETLHGTREGQLPVDAELRRAFQLTDREGAVAALLARGCSAGGVAEHLQVANSTAEKHLASLRQKLGVRTTTEAAAAVARFSLEQVAGIRDWPTSPPHDPELHADANGRELAVALAAASHVDAGVAALREHLASELVEAILFVFLPRNVTSFGRDATIESWAAPARLIDAYQNSGGLLAQPIAHDLFAQPDQEFWLDAQEADPAHASGPRDLFDACLEEGLGLCLALGAPFGCGYVGASLFFSDQARDDLREDRAARVSRVRLSLLMAQSSMFSRGLLARTVGLTVRERDALSLLARGCNLETAAAEMGGSTRGLSQQLKQAREKLGAATNAEAIAQAMALNALVFL
ncbi:MAG: hypothetical protein GY937_01390 [bacterium]|nr:hypothetical protein [bacterium]